MTTMTLLLLLAACKTSTPEPPGRTDACPPGEVLDGEACVPEACGVGTWGNLPVDGDTVYVAEGGDGDGTAENPLGSIQAALDLAGEREGGLVAVAAGTYMETLAMDDDHDGVVLAGRCRELVTIDGSEGKEVPAVEVWVGGPGRRPEIGIEGVTVTAGRYSGLWVEAATVAVEGVDIVENTLLGVFVGDAEVSLTAVRVSDTISGGDFGWGISVGYDATLTATGLTVEGNTGFGIFGSDDGTTVELVDTVVQDTAPSSDGSGGWGISVQSGTTLTATGCTVQGNTQVGVAAIVDGTTVELVDTVVQDTAPSSDGSGGWGIAVQSDATLIATGCAVRGNTDHGVQASDDGTTVDLVDTVVQDTAPSPDGSGGWGISVQDGATLTATGCTVQGNTEVGVTAGHDGTTVELVNTVVQDTAPSPGGSGRGINVEDGATLTATGCTVQGNTGLGVYASNNDTTVELVDTVVQDTAPRANGSGGEGVGVQEGATLIATGCTVQGNTGLGVYASDAGTTVELVDTVVQDTAPSSDGSGGRGIGVEYDARLTATNCTVQRNNDVGVFAAFDGTTVELVDTVVQDTRRGPIIGFAGGVVAEDSATLTLDSCTVSGTEGPGLYAVAGADVSLIDTALTSNTFAGALVLDAVVAFDNVIITDTVPDAQWGGGFAVYAVDLFGPPFLTVRSSMIGPHPYAAVWLDGDGTYLLEDNDLSGNAPVDLRGREIHGNAVFAERGVQAWDGTSGLSLVGNRIHGATEVAVLLDGSSAFLEGNTFESNGTDVWQQRCDDVPVLGSPEPDWVACDGGTLLTDSALQFTTLYLPEVEPE